MRTLWTLDFETDGIADRPHYPPIPRGVALKKNGGKAKYFAWGHPEKNNCDQAVGRQMVKDILRDSSCDILCHNAKFDIEVACTWLSLPLPDWRRVHDTLYLLFLDNPHAKSLSLKPAAEYYLDLPPEEQDAVHDWLVAHGIVRKGDKGWGAHICKAPGNVVGPYAVGDVERTYQLFKGLHERIKALGMLEAYDRERQLMPILLKNEQKGLRIDVDLLHHDVEMYEKAMVKCDAWLAKRLGVNDLRVDSDPALAAALRSSGVVTDFAKTPTGRDSVSKKNLLPSMFNDQNVARVLGYRNRLGTCLSTFMRPWAEREVDGRIYTNWNQVRQTSDVGGFSGTRTGRLSSSRPNFQNIPKTFEGKDDGYVHPTNIRLPTLPLIRKYVLPEKGHTILHRDYSQQELRILAHWEGDRMQTAYIENPRMDVHDFVSDEIERISGRRLERRQVKIMNFGIVYGMGQGKLAEGMGVTVETAAAIKRAHRAALPGIRAVETAIKARCSQGIPILTWGGRQYHPEPPRQINGRMVSFEYKLLNYMIQGSAADCTKQALINYDELCKDGEFLLTVHDEINVNVPSKAARKEMARLREAMESVEFNVPMLSDGKLGDTWGSLTKFEEK